MIALDTNVLVYAHRLESPWHERASATLVGLANGRAPWSIPWPCLHEFFAVVTNPRIFRVPTPGRMAVDQISAWLESPSLEVLSESAGYWTLLRDLIESGAVAGPLVHDARVAALCLHHGSGELWTADRDFGRFPRLRTRNPLVAS